MPVKKLVTRTALKFDRFPAVKAMPVAACVTKGEENAMFLISTEPEIDKREKADEIGLMILAVGDSPMIEMPLAIIESAPELLSSVKVPVPTIMATGVVGVAILPAIPSALVSVK